MTLIKKVFYRLFGAPVEVRIEEPKEELFLAVPTVWRNAR